LITILAATVTTATAQRLTPNHPQGDTGPGVPLIKAFLEAYNKQDISTLKKMVASDIAFLDDDGHTNLGRAYTEAFLESRLLTPKPETLTATGPITSSGAADVIWASFPYTFARGEIHRNGLITMIFRKAGSDWQVVHFHFAIDQMRANSLDRR
jgi:ketosteroid isomerase-like protein